MAYTHNSVSLRGFHFEDAHLTANLHADITRDHLGHAVTIDPDAVAGVKLAEDDDIIIGRLETFENRETEGSVVGAVSLNFSNLLPLADPAAVAVGQTAVGAGDGKIKGVAFDGTNFISEIDGDFAVVTKV